MTNTVMVGGLVLDGSDLLSERLTTGVTGWDDAPEVRSSMESKAQQDGSWDASGFFGSRAIEVSGLVSGATAAAAKEFGDSLRALSPRAVLELVVDSDVVGSRSTFARLTRGAVLEWANEREFTYTLQFSAPDPLLYAPPVSGSTGLDNVVGTGLVYPLAYPLDYGVPAGITPGSVAVPNGGTAAYWPRARIDGPVINPVITMNETGDWVRVNRTVAAGQWLDVDFANRRVLLNGSVSLAGSVTFSGRWLAVPVGGGSISWTADSADPAALLTINGFEGAYL